MSDTEREFFMTDRVKNLRNTLLGSLPTLTISRAVIVTEAYKKYEAEPVIVKRAKVFRDVLGQMPIAICPDELIVGHQADGPRRVALFPEFSVNWILKDLDHFEHRGGDRFTISQEDKKALRELLPKWENKTVSERVLCAIPEEVKAVMDSRAFLNPVYMSGVGHMIPDYPEAIAIGLEGILEKIEGQQKGLDLSDPTNFKKLNFLKAAKISCEAAISFADRYGDLALTMSLEEKDPKRAQELMRISQTCRTVPRRGASSFYEAVQSFWLIHIMTQIESNGYAVSPARFDQYMYPYYQEDRENGKLTKEEGQELLDCLWIKLNEVYKVREELTTQQSGGQPMFQNLLVGGQDRFGNDLTNELSYLCMQAEADIRLPQPSFSVRYHKGTPHPFMREVAKLIREGFGKPALFNDISIIPSLLNRGITMDEAREYAVVGCVEQSVPGKTYGGHGASKVNLAKILELTLHDGFDPISKKQIGPKTGRAEIFLNFEEFLKAFWAQLHYCINQMVIFEHVIDQSNSCMAPVPFLSLFIHDCIETGKDIMEGGAHYNFVGPEGVGVATVADSLACIKKLVYEEGKLSMKELLELLESNFQGEEMKRQMLCNRAPKYGNDDDYVDLLARDVAGEYCRRIGQYKGYRGGVFSPGLYTTTSHVPMGQMVGATPDGRFACTPLNDGVSPVQGRDILGPTASLKSVTKLDSELVSNGILLNFKIDPMSIEDDASLEKFIQLLTSYFKLGGQHIQINCICADTLKDAQAHPENYADLVIRVAGYSAFFTSLDKSLQDDLINRTEHRV